MSCAKKQKQQQQKLFQGIFNTSTSTSSPISLKPNPVKLLFNENIHVRATSLYQAQQFILRSHYMMSQHTGIARYPPSLETLSDLDSKSSCSLDCLVDFFLPLTCLSSFHCCLLSFCWTSNIGGNQLSSDHFILPQHSSFSSSHPTGHHPYAPEASTSIPSLEFSPEF